jgi:hypothetical protein
MPGMIQRLGPGGQTVNQVVDWAEGELESYNRT